MNGKLRDLHRTRIRKIYIVEDKKTDVLEKQRMEIWLSQVDQEKIDGSDGH